MPDQVLTIYLNTTEGHSEINVLVTPEIKEQIEKSRAQKFSMQFVYDFETSTASLETIKPWQ